MTEADWSACADPEPMLEFVKGKTSARKLRLFACACCRAIWPLLNDDRARHAIEVSEKFADGLASTRERAGARAAVVAATGRRQSEAAWAAYWTVSANIGECISNVCMAATGAASRAGAVGAVDLNGAGQAAAWNETQLATQQMQADMLRDIINPFQTLHVAGNYPATVVQLAEALYRGQDCAFALHDALLEAGQTVLAEHFRRDAMHPKGCWALDLLLDKN